MGDRRIVYLNQIPQDTDILWTNQNAYIALAKLAYALLGTTPLLNGFNCTQNGTPNLTVNVAMGEIYSLQNLDNTQYGSLSLDNSDQILKQGIVLSPTNVSCAAPVGSGTSINYLIEIGFLEQDIDSVVLPYYNAANITVPLSGPGNDGLAQPTMRQNTVSIQAKAGIAAATGTQVTPSADSGYVGAWVVTVNYGDTAIVNAAISQYLSTNFILETLTQKVSIPTGDLRWAKISSIQSGAFKYGIDTGTANTYVTSLSPAITSYSAGLIFTVKITHSNTGASTINANGVGVANIKLTNGNDPNAGDLLAGMLAELNYDGTNFQLMNPATAIFGYEILDETFNYIVDSGTANTYVATLTYPATSYVTGMRVSLKILHTNTSGTCTLNVSGLGVKNIKLTNGNALYVADLLAGMMADFRYDGTEFQLLNPASWVSQYDVQDGKYLYWNDSGTANTYDITISPAPAAYVAGMQFNVVFVHANTGASTLNVNSLGTKNITTVNGSALTAGTIVAGGVYPVIYNGTSFILLNLFSNPKLNNGAFFAYASASQSIGSGSALIQINTIVYDIAGYFNTGGYAYQPTLAGQYLIGGQVATNTQVELSFSISKNGSNVVANSTGTNTAVYIGGHTLVNMGTSDYVEINASAPGTATNTSQGATLTYMYGYGPI